jgi:predicted site-specific integrase-resolvase
MKRVAIYARVRTDKQQTSNQILVLKEIAERSGYNIILNLPYFLRDSIKDLGLVSLATVTAHVLIYTI